MLGFDPFAVGLVGFMGLTFLLALCVGILRAIEIHTGKNILPESMRKLTVDSESGNMEFGKRHDFDSDLYNDPINDPSYAFYEFNRFHDSFGGSD